MEWHGAMPLLKRHLQVTEGYDNSEHAEGEVCSYHGATEILRKHPAIYVDGCEENDAVY